MKNMISRSLSTVLVSTFCFLSLMNFQQADAQSIFRYDRGKYVCYKDSCGKTIVNGKKYTIAFTDTITSIGFVGTRKGRIVCINNQGKELFEVYKTDNGPDYACDGIFRIVGKDGKIGFSDTCGVVIIPPSFSYATPFHGGEANVTFDGEKQVQGEHQYWKSGHWFLLKKTSLFEKQDSCISKPAVSFLSDTLTTEEKHKIRERAALVPDSIRAHFSSLLHQWNFAITHNRETRLSSNTYSYAELPEFHPLKSMGRQIIPLIMEQLIDTSNSHLLVLYEAVQKDSGKIVKDNIGGEQNRAIRCIKKWLGCIE